MFQFYDSKAVVLNISWDVFLNIFAVWIEKNEPARLECLKLRDKGVPFMIAAFRTMHKYEGIVLEYVDKLETLVAMKFKDSDHYMVFKLTYM